MEIREPKFKRGDKVRNLEDGHAYTVESINDYKFMQDEYWYNLYEYWYNLSEHLCIFPESALELYIEKPKTVWDLEKGDTFYVIDSDGDVMKGTWVGNRFENNCRKREIGNIFLTKEEALFEAERRKVEAEMLQLGGRRKMKRDEDNYYISYDEKTGNFAYLMSIWVNVQGLIFFDTYVDVDKAVKAIGEDRIKKYIFGVE